MSEKKRRIGGRISAGSCAALMILQVLQQHSSEDFPLTQQDIIDHLHDDFGGSGITVERKKVSRDIKRLLDAGFPVKYKGGYYIDRPISDSELQFLIDGVLSSVQVSQTQGAKLIANLTQLGTPALHKNMRKAAAGNGNRSGLFWNADRVREAIKKNRQISFVKCEYVYDNGVQLKAVWDAPRRFSPLELVYLNGRYLLIAYSTEKTTGPWVPLFFDLHYMDAVDVVNTKKRQLPENYLDMDIRTMLKEHPFGLDGQTVRVTLKLPRAVFHDFVETFGTDFRCLDSSDKKYITVTLPAGEADVRRFVLAYAPDVQVLAPETFCTNIRKTAEKLAKNAHRWQMPSPGRRTQPDELRRLFVKKGRLTAHNVDLRDQTDTLRQINDVRSVDLCNNELHDLSFLKDYRNMIALYLESEPATDLSFITGMPMLGRLELRDMKLDSLAFLRDCKHLRMLTLINCQVADMPWYDLSFLFSLKVGAFDLRDVDLQRLRQSVSELIIEDPDDASGLSLPRPLRDYRESKPKYPLQAMLLATVFGEPEYPWSPIHVKWLMHNKDLQRDIESVCADLGVNERHALEGRLTGRNVAEIAAETGFSCEAIETFYNNAVRLLQEPSRAKRLRPYFKESDNYRYIRLKSPEQ